MAAAVGLGAQKPYARWIFESLKVVGAACIAAIVAMQITIAVIQEQLNTIRRDVDRIRQEGDRLHEVAERQRDNVLRELKEIKGAIHDHEVDSLRRQLGNGRGDYGVPQP